MDIPDGKLLQLLHRHRDGYLPNGLPFRRPHSKLACHQARRAFGQIDRQYFPSKLPFGRPPAKLLAKGQDGKLDKQAKQSTKADR